MKNIFADDRLVLIQGGMALKSSMGLPGAVASQTELSDEVVTIGVMAITGQGSKDIAEAVYETRKIAGSNGVIYVNVMAADSRAAMHTKAALDTGEVDGVIQGAGISRDVPRLCEEYGIPFAPIIKSADQVAKYKRMFKVYFFVYEASEAGGHLGSLDHFLFADGDNTLEEIVAAAGDTPVVGAGSVTPDRVQSVIKRGARGIQIATPYLLTAECALPQHVKEFYAKSDQGDVVLVDSAAGMPGRALSNFLAERFPLDKESGECLPPEAFGKKCVNCIKHCKCRDSGYTQSFCIRGALIAAKEGNLDLGLYFTGDAIGYWNELTTVKEVTDLYLNEMYDFMYSR